MNLRAFDKYWDQIIQTYAQTIKSIKAIWVEMYGRRDVVISVV